MHDPRAFAGLGLQYATMNRGACHLALAYTIERGVTIPDLGFTKEFTEKIDRFALEGKANIVKVMQDFTELHDAFLFCKFLIFAGVTLTVMTKALNLVTGWNLKPNDLMEIGERIFNIKRLFNVKCGISRKDDTLPKRVYIPLKEGGTKGFTPKLEPLLDEYYKIRGWDENGVPTKEKLLQLEII